MNLLRRCRTARWLILSLAIISLVALPPLGASCVCASCGAGDKAAENAGCCSTAEPAANAACCCSAATCCSQPAAAETCCALTDGGCECMAVPDSREPAPLPSSDSPAKDLTVTATLQADWQLPAVIPVVADGCHESALGPPPRAVSVQIAFCVWRN